MSTNTKLALGGIIVAFATVYVVFLGASGDWSYYLTTDECLEAMADLKGQRLRVSGTIVGDSLRVTGDGVTEFQLAGTSDSLCVTSSGYSPDGLVEGIDVVVHGQLDDRGTLRGSKILTRCASKYEPKSLEASSRVGTTASRGGVHETPR